MKTFAVLLCSGLMALIFCAQPISAQEKKAGGKGKKAQAQTKVDPVKLREFKQKYGDLRRKMTKIEKQLEKDPEIVEARKKMEESRQLVNESQEVIYEKIAEKDPEFKVLLDQKKTLRAQLEEVIEESREQQKSLSEVQKKFSELRKGPERGAFKELRGLAMQMARGTAKYANDPEIKKLNETVEARKKAMEAAQDAVFEAIAEKDPEFKKLFDRRQALQKSMQADIDKRAALRKNSGRLQATYMESRRKAYPIENQLRELEARIQASLRQFRRDPDLRGVFDVASARQNEYNDARQLPEQVLSEKSPEYKELLEQRRELGREFSKLRRANGRKRQKRGKRAKQDQKKEI